MKKTKLFVLFLSAALAAQPAMAFAENECESSYETVESAEEAFAEEQEGNSEDVAVSIIFDERVEPAVVENNESVLSLDADEQKAADEFISSLAVTSNFDIYADTFSQNCHVDGNVAVNQLKTDKTADGYWNSEKNEWVQETVPSPTVEELKKGGYTEPGGVKDLDSYSIIFDGHNLQHTVLDNGATLVSGNMKKPQNLNDGAVHVDVTEALNEASTKEEKIDVVAQAIVTEYGKDMSDSDKEALRKRVEKEADINGNLDKISDIAQMLAEKLSKKTDITGIDAVIAAIEMLPNLDSKSVVAINASVHDLNTGLNSKLDELLKANKAVGAKIILNVIPNSENTTLTLTEALNFNDSLNGNTPYEPATSYLIWNFGSFGGTVEFTKANEGIIVAPNATVKSAVLDGRIIAREVIQGFGQEIHQPNVPKEIIELDEQETETETIPETETEDETTPETETEDETTPETETEDETTVETEPEEETIMETESEIDESESDSTDRYETDETEVEKETGKKDETETETDTITTLHRGNDNDGHGDGDGKQILKRHGSTPKTGDTVPIMALITTLVGSIAAIFISLITLKKDH